MSKQKPSKQTRSTKSEEDSKYRAPALERGLDVLKLLTAAPRMMKISEITAALGRTQSELFRIIHVLAQQGYVERSTSGAYGITNQLFRLGMERPPIRDLTITASPVMRELASTIGQSCHLAVRSLEQIVVIYRIEAPGEIGFSVRTGYRRPIASTTSGLVLFAFQPPDVQDEIRRQLLHADPELDLAEFEEKCDEIKANGFSSEQSQFVRGIVDLSCPILESGSAVAALTIPFVDSQAKLQSKRETLASLIAASDAISKGLLAPSSSLVSEDAGEAS